MNTKPYLIISGIIFGLIALGHALRLIFRWSVTFQGRPLPLWTSGVAFVIGVILCLWAYRFPKR